MGNDSKRIRRELGVSTPGKVLFSINADGEVVLHPIRFTVSALRGIVSAIPDRDPGDFEEMIREAMDEKADEIVADRDI
jgi:hypothetical protein